MKIKIENHMGVISDFLESGLSRLNSSFEPIRQKILTSDQIAEFLELCYSLARVSPFCAGFLQEKHFLEIPMKLKIKTLGNKGFRLVLPAAVPGIKGGTEPSIADGTQGDESIFSDFINLLPESCHDISLKANPLGLVPTFFPEGQVDEQVRCVACCFWTWLCIVDDLTESLVGQEWERVESDLMLVFNARRDSTNHQSYFDPESCSVKVSQALNHVIDSTAISYKPPMCAPWKPAFKKAVKEVIAGFRAEKPLLTAERIQMSDWMSVRMITISVRPLMILAKASLNLDPTMSNFGNPLREADFQASYHCRGYDATLAKIERILQLIMGLQNDILGWEKDHITSNPLNAIQILIKDGAKPRSAFKIAVETHNELVQQLFHYGDRAWVESLTAGEQIVGPNNYIYGATIKSHRNSITNFISAPKQRLMPDEDMQKYIELIMGFANGMANWMAVSKRYAA